jgi:hypothetical protein
MATTTIQLSEAGFNENERLLVEMGELKAYTFRYPTGVCALRVCNSRGEIVLLPFQGQQIWSAAFDGRDLTMKSMFEQPRGTRNYLETYGGFLLHCGATAMGVPGPNDNHPLHGELPNAPYQSAWLTTGTDQEGDFIALSGIYQHTVAFNFNYRAQPLVKLHSNSTLIDVQMDILNLKNSEMPLMYLAHANFRPIDNSRLVYSAKADPEHVKVRTSIPSHIHPLPGYKEFLQELQKDPAKHHVLKPGLSFDPEVVFFIDYIADEEGWAHSIQKHPDGNADYIAHRPSQLSKGVRWICRTADQDALGLNLPATAEPEGFQAEMQKGNVRSLPAKSNFHLDMKMGALTPQVCVEIEQKINRLIGS